MKLCVKDKRKENNGRRLDRRERQRVSGKEQGARLCEKDGG
jgi:hypothetical protein